MAKWFSATATISEDTKEKVDKTLEAYHITMCIFLRACILELIECEDPETFLKDLGFKKKEVLIRE